MPEQLQQILDKILEWWKKFNTKQKTLLASITAVILLSLVILAVVVSKPEMITLYTCTTLTEAASVQDLLTNEGISFETSEDGMSFSVEKSDYANARILLGSNEIATGKPSLESVFDGGFSSTSEDKEKLYKDYLQEDLADVLEQIEGIEGASVRLDLPSNDGTIISKDEQASVSVLLTLEKELTAEQASGIAQFLATNVGNEDTSRIKIIDNRGNVLFSDEEEQSVTGNASTQQEMKQKAESLIKQKIKDVLVGSSIYDNAEIAMNLDMDFDQYEEKKREYYAPDGQTNGMIGSKSEYESTTQGGSAGSPGTDSNGDDTTYVIQDSEITLSTITDTTVDYQNNERITTYIQSVGKIDCETSSISIVLTDWVVYSEDILKATGALDEMSFDEYIAANSDPVKRTVDEDYYELVANATGFPVESITILSYAQPMFEYSSNDKSVSDYLQFILALLIFALLGFVVFRSTRREEEPEVEEELSVENLLESTKETTQDTLEDIGYNEKSETRLLIEKFVEQNPEAAATLLRNWLNEDWE